MRTAALAAVLLAVVALPSCGSDDDASGSKGDAQPDGVVDISGTEPVGQLVAGSVAAMVNCGDWQGADEGERLATIDDIRRQLAPQDSGIQLPQLTDEEAAEVFDDACKIEGSGGFRLYKLYAQAAGFVTLKRQLEHAARR